MIAQTQVKKENVSNDNIYKRKWKKISTRECNIFLNIRDLHDSLLYLMTILTFSSEVLGNESFHKRNAAYPTDLKHRCFQKTL